ncbi:MAG: hypothetical protein R2827_06325 [Bdellovibrionales bacterium]
MGTYIARLVFDMNDGKALFIKIVKVLLLISIGAFTVIAFQNCDTSQPTKDPDTIDDIRNRISIPTPRLVNLMLAMRS